MRRILSVISVLLVMCMLATACNAKKRPSQSPGSTAYRADMEDINEDGISADTSNNPAKSVKSENKSNDFDKRKLIKDVSLSIQTKSFDEFMSNLQNEITKYSGYVQKSNITGNSYSSSSNRRASVEIRIPSDKLEEFTGLISSLGNVVNKAEKVQDITMSYVDIESHIKALKTEQDSLLKLLEKASNLSDILTIQDELTKVRSELESYESKLRTYDNLISYSTITMDITEVEQITKVEKQGMWQEIGSKLSANLKNIGNGFRSFFIWFISALPYLLLIAVPVLIIILIVRKSHKKKVNTDKLPPFFPPKENE